MKPVQAIYLSELFPPLHQKLCDLLSRLSEEDWQQPTAASEWNVKNVAAHLLDGDVRRLSFQRDGQSAPEPSEPITGYESLVAYLNNLNATWAVAAERMSPRVILTFLEVTGPQVHRLFEALDPHEEAAFGVAWAGQETSPNWLDVARECTEKWHHQQQIRDAVGAPLLTGKKWMRPLLRTLVRGLPHAYRNADAPEGSQVTVEATGEAGSTWTLKREAAEWHLYAGEAEQADARVRFPSEVAWRSFAGLLPPEEAKRKASVSGNERLAEPAFAFVGFMK